MPRMLGLMFAGPESAGLVFGLGLIVHVMMGVLFAIVYALLFAAFGIEANWLSGAIFGAGHGVLAGVAFAQ